ncbi:hypothetical protein WJX81_008350 [Elliptochloris bilobata]|uniref:Proteasome assembly chaperone 2 n=1 Tax=Elliptochloris bilobata TaxID=381761 RepID=A0AAW1QNH5_9CHLO
MELHNTGSEAADLRGKTLVLPAVTIGNVGQLAADLLINTLLLPCAGSVQEPSLLPCVGLGAYDRDAAGTLSTEMQLYADPAQSWAIVQQRSPPAAGRQEAFAASLTDFVAEAGVCQVLLLASADAALRGDEQLASPAVRFSATSEAAAAAARELRFVELEDPAGEQPSAQSMLPPWPLWRALKACGVPVLLLMWHASEGDNTADALVLATAAAQALEKLQGAAIAAGPGGPGGGGADGGAAGGWAWVAPRSWGAALYGSKRVLY